MDHDLACPVLLRRKGESALQKWKSAVAVAVLRLPTVTPTAIHWKMTDNGPTWIIPPFQGHTLHSYFAATIERWGNLSICNLKLQLLCSKLFLSYTSLCGHNIVTYGGVNCHNIVASSRILQEPLNPAQGNHTSCHYMSLYLEYIMSFVFITWSLYNAIW